MAATNPLPPGGNGLPLLGETLAFANNPFAFIHQRHARHGDVFRTSILGSPTVFFVGPKLAATYLDPAKIQREGAMPANLTALFGGYDIARYVHFFCMASIVAFLAIHVLLALLVPRSLRAMIIGR